MRIFSVGYDFNVTKSGVCLNNCTGHGLCTEEGECQCAGNWAGGDCSVDTSAGTCQQGSRLPSKRCLAKDEGPLLAASIPPALCQVFTAFYPVKGYLQGNTLPYKAGFIALVAPEGQMSTIFSLSQYLAVLCL